MKTYTRQFMRLAVMSVGLAGVFVALNPVPGAATPPVGFSSQLLGRGTYVSHESLPLRQGLDIVTVKLTVAPGGSAGCHSQPGGSIVIVQQGEITILITVEKGDKEQGQSQS